MIRIYRSSLIPSEGFIHGFPERGGGVSTGSRSSLNLGVRWGDDQHNVAQNRRRLAEFAGYDPDQLVATRHVHGVAVYTVGEPLQPGAEFDGLVCDRVGPVLGAFAADCIPILFADPEARICGAAHAGWRGTVAGIAARVIERMTALGACPERVRVALGPSIGPCCFEVGAEVVAEFRAALGDVPNLVVAGPSHKDHIDLRVASRYVLQGAGVVAEHIDDRPPCTRCDDRFFSYRRDGQQGGVHMAFIGLVAGR